MPVDRELWQSRVSAADVPNWPCPRCGATTLSLVEGSFHTVADSVTKRNWDEPSFEPEFVTGRFVCLLECTKPGCREGCAVSGNYTTMTEELWEGPRFYANGLPTSIMPPPPIIRLPASCPKEIKGEVRAAFSLFWIDYSSALNRIRNAIELLLTKMGTKRFGTKKTGGRSRLTLDARIQILRSKKPALSDLCDRLLAVKHLGNAGSHPGDVHIDDVFDGFDILEQILQDTYSNDTSVLARMVSQINGRKGPRKKGKA